MPILHSFLAYSITSSISLLLLGRPTAIKLSLRFSISCASSTAWRSCSGDRVEDESEVGKLVQVSSSVVRLLFISIISSGTLTRSERICCPLVLSASSLATLSLSAVHSSVSCSTLEARTQSRQVNCIFFTCFSTYGSVRPVVR